MFTVSALLGVLISMAHAAETLAPSVIPTENPRPPVIKKPSAAELKSGAKTCVRPFARTILVTQRGIPTHNGTKQLANRRFKNRLLQKEERRIFPKLLEGLATQIG
jgi:hypothetical protein